MAALDKYGQTTKQPRFLLLMLLLLLLLLLLRCLCVLLVVLNLPHIFGIYTLCRAVDELGSSGPKVAINEKVSFTSGPPITRPPPAAAPPFCASSLTDTGSTSARPSGLNGKCLGDAQRHLVLVFAPLEPIRRKATAVKRSASKTMKQKMKRSPSQPYSKYSPPIYISSRTCTAAHCAIAAAL